VSEPLWSEQPTTVAFRRRSSSVCQMHEIGAWRHRKCQRFDARGDL